MSKTNIAFILDLDGVIADTTPLHFKAWKKVANNLGLQFNEHINDKLRGVSREESMRVLLRENTLNDNVDTEEMRHAIAQKNNYYIEQLALLSPKDLLPGMESFLQQAQNSGILLALASASKNAQTVIERLKIRSYFSYIADAGKIKNSKPHPEIFTVCANALGISPLFCAGIEDAAAGIQAIKAAGLFAVGIGPQTLCQEPDLYFSSTQNLNCSTIVSEMKRHK